MIPARRPGVLALIPGLIPGLIACVAVALVAVAVQALEVRLVGRGWLGVKKTCNLSHMMVPMGTIRGCGQPETAAKYPIGASSFAPGSV